MSDRDTITELIERMCPHGGGVRVTNCVAHSFLTLTERPTECKLCSRDIQNRLELALRINEWLNEWKADASKLLENGVVAP